jgi:hypothetical protein
MRHDVAHQRVAATDADRREHERIAGPFDGWRVGALDTPLRIYDLSPGGCFVNSMHEQAAGTRLTIKVVVPEIGTLTLEGETLYERNGFGFAVRFVDVDAETAQRLHRAVEILQPKTPLIAPQPPLAPAPVVLALAPPAESHGNRGVREAQPSRSAPATRAVQRPRGLRAGMVGAGYRVLIDGQQVTLINLSLSGVQVRGAVHPVLAQPVLVHIGWPQDTLSFTAIARVRWVQPEGVSGESESIYRIGLAFDTWDVRRVKEIIASRGAPAAPKANVAGIW